MSQNPESCYVLRTVALLCETNADALHARLGRKDPLDEIDADRAVLGLDPDQYLERGTCCEAVPGERIVGITQRGKGVVVHTIDCASLTEFEDDMERWVDLHWQPGRHHCIYPVAGG